jgi:hypothetical protein
MCYLPDFKYDIFLSYAHIDNETLSEAEKGWVTRFYEELRLRINQRVGRSDIAQIWWDKKLRKNHEFDNEIKDSIAQSALLITFSSNGYYESGYCIDELKWFYQHAADSPIGIAVNNKSRIYNIRINKIKNEAWPPECKGITGYDMFELADAENDKLGFPIEPGSHQFSTRIKELANDIYDLLCQIKNKAGKPIVDVLSDEKANGSEKPGVFFAKVADTLANEKEQIIRDLEANNIVVFKQAVPPPYSKADHKKAIEKILEKSCLSVHLFDHIAGDEIEPGYATFSEEQLNIARQTSKEQLIFIPKELNIDEIKNADAHKKFLKNLQDNKSDTDKYCFIREFAPPNMIQEIKEKIKKIETRNVGQTEHVGGPQPAVFLDFHEQDSFHAINMSNFLNLRGIRTFLCANGHNPAENIKFFEDTLRQVTSLIIIRGGVAKKWVEERLNKAIEIILKDEYPFSALGIYMAPRIPYENIPIKQRFLNIQLLDDSKNSNFSPDTITPFIKLIA